MGELRTPFQGVFNIIRFNWHFYAMAIFVFLLLGIAVELVPKAYTLYLIITLTLSAWITIVSLLVSFYIYDLSDLYSFHFLDELALEGEKKCLNIHAGFDETSVLIQQKYPEINLRIFDFYNPTQHTEISIQRARNAYPVPPNTQIIQTTQFPLADNEIDYVFILLSAHEIRNHNERIAFFEEVRRVTKHSGKIIVLEHLRDFSNFLAYTIGFFHFLSYSIWFNTFEKAQLKITQEIKLTPFITTFIIEKK